MQTTRYAWAVLATTVMLCGADGGCGKNKQPSTISVGSGGERPVSYVEDEGLRGLRMVLREAGPPATEAAQVTVAEGRPLDDRRIDALLGKVPDLEVEAGDRTPFAKREGSLPPPLSGSDVDVPFPPPDVQEGPGDPTPGALTVLRYAPEGDVPLAPHLNVTFSDPMVAVSSQAEAAETIPLRLTPTPAGQWRWLGTRTVQFQPEPRFPMATEYTVEVPAGTESANGDTLAEAVSFTFTTPPPGLTTQYPTYGPHDLTPVIVVGFDQRIDPGAMEAFLELRSGKGKHPLRRATAEEIAADEGARSVTAAAEEGRWIALIPKQPLPKATSFTMTVAKGAPSAEGPRTTPGEQSFGFYTYDPLKITEHHCSWYDECPPNVEWYVEFNNPLDEEQFDPALITCTPEVPGMLVRQWGSSLTIGGVKQGRTTYKVTVAGGLTDRFGQTLGKDETVTFKVGPAEKTLFGPGKELVVLDPAGPPALSVFSTNHDKLRVRVWEVTPDDWQAWNAWQQKYRWDDANPGPPPGDEVRDDRIKVEGGDDSLTETFVDLEPYLDDGHGQYVVWVEPTKQPKERWYRQEVLAWVQVTDIGLTAFADYEELVAWTTALGSGAALDGVELSVLPDGEPTATSDGEGLARMTLPATANGPQVLVARKGSDAALLPQNQSWWGDYAGWVQIEQHDQLRWFTFDDRGLYRPTEEVRVKGWIRQFEPWKNGDVQALKQSGGTVQWKLTGPRGNDIAEGQAPLSALGGFDLKVTLPDNINLGTAWLNLSATGTGAASANSHGHPIQIQEFRRPEFEVSSTAEEGPFVLGHEAIVTVDAAYYAGGGLPGAPVYWNVHASPGSFRPPNTADYQFGVWSPWWWFWGNNDYDLNSYQSLEGKTDAVGRHYLGIHFEALNPARPMTVTAEASVTDVNRQTWAASSTLLVHPSSWYVGLKTDKGFVGEDEPIHVDTKVFDLDGLAVTGATVDVTMARLAWEWKGGEYREIETDRQECSVTSDDEDRRCSFEPPRGGTYRITARVEDGQGRPNETEIRVWVAGGERPPSRDVEMERVTLIPEREEYQPGETARFLVQAPFAPAEGVLTIRRSGLVRTERFSMSETTQTLEVPILEEHIPDVTVQVDLVGAAVRPDDQGQPQPDLPRRVAYASGSLTFQVPPLLRTLTVEATPREPKVAPGGKTTVDLTVTDAAGGAVEGAEVAVVIVDESVLALTGYQTPDPLTLFYSARGAGVSDYHQRSQVVLSDPAKVAAMAAAIGAGMANGMIQTAAPAPAGGMAAFGSGSAPMDDLAGADFEMAEAEEAPAEPSASRGLKMEKKAPAKGKDGRDKAAEPETIAVRVDFSALALFAPAVTTDGSGKARVEVELPDSLTRYRVMAIAVAGGQQFGAGESSITARLPLMTRPSPPRFLNFGDRFELSVVLQNQTDRAMDVDVAVRASNVSLAATLDEARPGDAPDVVTTGGQRISVPANDRVEVRFPAASQLAGTARFQVVSVAGSYADAATFDLPVWTPATAEAFATYGVIDDGAIRQPVQAPEEVWPQFGGLEITTSSTQLQALTDAVLYLVQYPYDCNEQIASRVLAIAALRDVLGAFESAELPPPEELERVVDSDLEKLAARQNWNGGWSFWRKGDQDWPYLTVHVAHAMARAHEKGYELPAGMWDRTRPYLADIESHIPHWYSQESRWAIRAYALNVRHKMDDTDVHKAKKLLKEAGVEQLPLEAQGWILPVLDAGGATAEADEIERHLMNRVAESAAGAHFVTSYSDGAHVLLHSDRRADGVILESLIQTDPDNDVIPKIVTGLLDHRKKGKWLNTQENCFVLLSLDRYFNVYEKETPDFVARAWLGDQYAGDHAFRGRTTERAHIDIPMGYLTETPGEQPLTLQKDGTGRMYYRIGMRYAPRDLALDPADYGFAVERVYEPVDDDADVTRDEDGTWRVKAGARVRVRLTMVAPMRRYHVALVDPLPAGLEPINPELAVSETVPPDQNSDRNQGGYWWWYWPWYEHENLRDERVEAFTSLLWDGVHEYTYVARATTPGEFVVPPTKAEEMYHPETFGRTGTDKLIVE